jgi:alpha-glucosidase
MTRGADGVRIDVAHMLMKDPGLRDNPPAPEGFSNPYELQPEDYLSQRHVNDRGHSDLRLVLAEIRATMDEFDHRVSIGEVEAVDWDAWAGYFGENGTGLHLPFAFQLIETPWEAAAMADAVGSLERALPEDAWPILALGNHDRSRLATRLGRPQARIAAMLLLTLRGTPTILYGDELGMADQPVPLERQRDHFGLAEGVSHDPIRTPMPWNGGPNGGFSDAAPAATWLPACHEYETINVEAQLADRTSSLNLYRRLLELRKAGPALSTGSYTHGPLARSGCLTYSRAAEGEELLVALNLTGVAQVLPQDRSGTVVASTGLTREGESLAAELRLGADEGIVARLDHQAGSPSRP